MKVWKSLICVLVLSFMIVGSVSATAGQVFTALGYGVNSPSSGKYIASTHGYTLERFASADVEKIEFLPRLYKQGVLVEEEMLTTFKKRESRHMLQHVYYDYNSSFFAVGIGNGYYTNGTTSRHVAMTDYFSASDYIPNANHLGEFAKKTGIDSLSKLESLQIDIKEDFIKSFNLDLEGYVLFDSVKTMNTVDSEFDRSLELLLFDVLIEQEIGDGFPLVYLNNDKGTGYIFEKRSDGTNNLFVIEQNKNGEWILDSKDQKTGNLIPEKYYKD